MKKSVVTLFLIAASVVFTKGQSDYYFTRTGTLSFVSNAPLEIIKASSNQMMGLIDETKKTFSFKVQYRSFDGFNSSLQREHFNEKYMESEKYPEAVFNGTIIDSIDFKVNGTYLINAKGKLSIHGVEKERTIKSTVTVNNGLVHIESNFVVELEDYNIKIPKIVTQKIATEIIIELNADMKNKMMAR